VKGNVHATGKIEIKKGGSVNGNLTTAQILIEDGADFRGSIEIDRGAKKFPRGLRLRPVLGEDRLARGFFHSRLRLNLTVIMVKVLIEEMSGVGLKPTERLRTSRVVAVGVKEIAKTTLRSEWRSSLKKSLTGPTC
jgi:Polymer-forming cytoskeletal